MALGGGARYGTIRSIMQLGRRDDFACLEIDQVHRVLTGSHRQEGTVRAECERINFVSLLIHELSDGTPTLKLRLDTGLPIGIAALNVDGTQIATGTIGGKMILWNVGTGQKHKELSPFSGDLTTAAFSPDGRLLAAGGQEHFPALWDLSSGVRLPFPDVHNGTIRSVEFSKDGKTMVTASGDNTLILWDVTGPEPRRRGPPLIGHRGAVLQTAFSPGRQIPCIRQ